MNTTDLETVTAADLNHRPPPRILLRPRGVPPHLRRPVQVALDEDVKMSMFGSDVMVEPHLSTRTASKGPAFSPPDPEEGFGYLAGLGGQEDGTAQIRSGSALSDR